MTQRYYKLTRSVCGSGGAVTESTVNHVAYQAGAVERQKPKNGLTIAAHRGAIRDVRLIISSLSCL